MEGAQGRWKAQLHNPRFKNIISSTLDETNSPETSLTDDVAERVRGSAGQGEGVVVDGTSQQDEWRGLGMLAARGGLQVHSVGPTGVPVFSHAECLDSDRDDASKEPPMLPLPSPSSSHLSLATPRPHHVVRSQRPAGGPLSHRSSVASPPPPSTPASSNRSNSSERNSEQPLLFPDRVSALPSSSSSLGHQPLRASEARQPQQQASGREIREEGGSESALEGEMEGGALRVRVNSSLSFPRSHTIAGHAITGTQDGRVFEERGYTLLQSHLLQSHVSEGVWEEEEEGPGGCKGSVQSNHEMAEVGGGVKGKPEDRQLFAAGTGGPVARAGAAVAFELLSLVAEMDASTSDGDGEGDGDSDVTSVTSGANGDRGWVVHAPASGMQAITSAELLSPLTSPRMAGTEVAVVATHRGRERERGDAASWRGQWRDEGGVIESRGDSPNASGAAAGGAMRLSAGAAIVSGAVNEAHCVASGSQSHDRLLNPAAAHSSAIDAAMDAMCGEMSEGEGGEVSSMVEGMAFCGSDSDDSSTGIQKGSHLRM